MSDEVQPVVPLAPRVAKQPERPKLLEIMGPGLITGASDDALDAGGLGGTND
jgi:hypothetical protein